MTPLRYGPLHGNFLLLPIENVHYGAGCVSALADSLAAHGITRALLITGNTLATRTPLVERVMAAAGGRIAAVFHDTVQHVTPRFGAARGGVGARHRRRRYRVFRRRHAERYRQGGTDSARLGRPPARGF